MKEVLSQFINDGRWLDFNGNHGDRDWPNFFTVFERKLGMLLANFDMCEKAGEQAQVNYERSLGKQKELNGKWQSQLEHSRQLENDNRTIQEKIQKLEQNSVHEDRMRQDSQARIR